MKSDIRTYKPTKQRVDIGDVCRKLIVEHHQRVEAWIRSYLRSHKTTRLDIAVSLGEFRVGDGHGPLFRKLDDANNYALKCYRDVYIYQRLPAPFRPCLPD